MTSYAPLSALTWQSLQNIFEVGEIPKNLDIYQMDQRVDSFLMCLSGAV